MIAKNIVFVLPLAFLIVASCTKEPLHEIRDARQESIANQKNLAQEQANLDQKQAEKRAELARVHSDQHSELHGTKIDEAAAQAKAARVEEQRNQVASHKRRIHEADTRANELYSKAQDLKPHKRQKFEVAWSVYTSHRDEAITKTQVSQYAASGDWQQSKPETEACLMRLEKSVDKMDRIF